MLDGAQRLGRLGRVHEVIPLIGEIERRLHSSDQVEQLCIDAGDPARQGSVELIERCARLQRRHRIDEIGDGFGLDEIHPAVQKRAQRELAGLGKACAAVHRFFNNVVQHRRAAVRADLDDVFTGIGVRSGEVGRDHMIADIASAPGGIRPDTRKRRVSGAKLRREAQHGAGNLNGQWATHSDDPNPATSRGRRDGDDSVFRAEHNEKGVRPLFTWWR